jgi:hypothetical protein
MCEECEQAEPLATIYWRKANRYGWRPPANAATAVRYDDDAPSRRRAAPDFVCVDASAREVDRCA